MLLFASAYRPVYTYIIDVKKDFRYIDDVYIYIYIYIIFLIIIFILIINY